MTMKSDDIGKEHANDYIIYDRRSIDDADNQRNSLAYQEQTNVKFAKENNLPIAKLTVPGYCKDGIINESHSGYAEDDDFILNADGTVQYKVDRPKFLWLVRLLKEKKIKGVVFLVWDRASRNKPDDVLIKRLMKLGSDIRFSHADYDQGTSSGHLHMDIDGMFAAHYSRVVSEKIRQAYEKLRAEGRCLYNSPIGYLDEGSDNKPLDPERAPAVKRIFELYSTGEWSFRELAKWARKQGLTKKPMRRKRTKQEILDNLDLASLDKRTRPVDEKTIEYILHSRFYIGEVKLAKLAENETLRGADAYIYGPSTAHEPLIDRTLFRKVQAMLKSRQKTVHHIDKDFYTYRTMLRCTCGRSFSPYVKKGIIYYRSRCKAGCGNPDANLNESEIITAISDIMKTIAFTKEEIEEIEAESHHALDTISARRSKTLDDLHAQQRRIIADIEYLTKNRITLLRSGATPESIVADAKDLEGQLDAVHARIAAEGESAPEMLRFILRFSELVENASLYYELATEDEKRLLTATVFSELVFADRELVKYSPKDGFEALLKRPVNTGAPFRIRT